MIRGRAVVPCGIINSAGGDVVVASRAAAQPLRQRSEPIVDTGHGRPRDRLLLLLFIDSSVVLLIIVVVSMDFMAQVQAYMMSHQYESLLKKAPRGMGQ